MINRTFEGKKYWRTYIGGSKEKELEIFLKVQGTKEDNSECDWLEYRRIFTTYFDDLLHVLISWRELLNKWSYITLISCVFFLKYPIVLLILIGLSITFRIIRFILKIRQAIQLRNYDIGLDVALNEIRKQTGLELSKN